MLTSSALSYYTAAYILLISYAVVRGDLCGQKYEDSLYKINIEWVAQIT